MTEIMTILSKIDVPTNELKVQFIQEWLIKTKKHSKFYTQNHVLWNKVSEVLWKHLQLGLNTFDDQLLCATCYYSLLSLTDQRDICLNNILEIIRNELILSNSENKTRDGKANAISLMYGLFQSAFLKEVNVNSLPIIVSLLEVIIELLLLMAYEYSKYTFIIFKIIGSFKKVCGTDLQGIIYSKDNLVRLFNLVNHNWENPITGIRDLNRSIFETLISVLNNKMYDFILEEINSFHWNKAKYLMLSEIIEQSKQDLIMLIQNNNWTYGLLQSLYKPGLVSAGADMYYAVLKKIKSEQEWCTLFLDHITKILLSPSTKAIEHWSNYWCLITLKRFPSLAKIILTKIMNSCDSEVALYGCVYLIKQANKLGLISKCLSKNSDFTDKVILHSLGHCNTHIRMTAFDVVCVSKSKTLPTKAEFDEILNFLKDNINSDCTVLRINMLNSFKNFLIRLHMTFLNNKNNDDLENLQKFCITFQEFIIDSISMNGNYQRKVTTIKIINVFLKGLCEVPRKRQLQVRQSDVTIIDILKHRKEWFLSDENIILKMLTLLKDPAEDIRTNVILLLLTHYTAELKQPEFINFLIENALSIMKSKFFYEISCGHSMFEIVIKLLFKENQSNSMFKTLEDVYYFAYKELITEYRLKRSIVDSIENGKQLHSFMNILYALLDTCIQNRYKLIIPGFEDLLEVLDGISNQFAWEEANSTSSDFSKLSDMVENIIKESDYDYSGNDPIPISGLHQIVLNCLWLNVKASCDVASLLICYQSDNSQIAVCEKSLNLIIHVLETCRHKGAIEAAGSALGRSIKHLTSLPEDLAISKIPYSLLKCKLRDLITEASRMASITRRGAGLSIMVHRIVSSDIKKGKPLFHYFMKALLETCNMTQDVPGTEKTHNVDNEKDLPKAIYIHFLTKIVMDSSLASEMMFYSTELAELAFHNLTSSHWQIRNAALQLYGALIPKLIGQKKVSGVDEESIATLACDELRTHSPKLWDYILTQLKRKDYSDILQYHSNLLPILNMLANCAMRYNFSFNMLEQRKSDEDLFKSLVYLLGSPIYTVRRLTAKCIFNIFTMQKIYEVLLKQEFVCENFLHGCLMLLVNCHKFYYDLPHYKKYIDSLLYKFSIILSNGEHSYLSKERFEVMVNTSAQDTSLNNIVETLYHVDRKMNAPGISHWANMRFYKYFESASWEMILQILENILKRNNFDLYGQTLLQRINKDKHIPNEVLQQITETLLMYEKKYDSNLVWQVLYNISVQTEMNVDLNIPEIMEFLGVNNMPYKLRYIIPFLARMSAMFPDKNVCTNISKIIATFTDCEPADVDLRYIAALANNEFGKIFVTLPESAKINVIISAIILLQDEDEDVRKLSVIFYKNVTNSKLVPQPYICLHKIINLEFLSSLITSESINVVIRNLTDLIETFSSGRNDDCNPFANDPKNIYLEPGILQKLIRNVY